MHLAHPETTSLLSASLLRSDKQTSRQEPRRNWEAAHLPPRCFSNRPWPPSVGNALIFALTRRPFFLSFHTNRDGDPTLLFAGSAGGCCWLLGATGWSLVALSFPQTVTDSGHQPTTNVRRSSLGNLEVTGHCETERLPKRFSGASMPSS